MARAPVMGGGRGVLGNGEKSRVLQTKKKKSALGQERKRKRFRCRDTVLIKKSVT
jgi:hypothetical protein